MKSRQFRMVILILIVSYLAIYFFSSLSGPGLRNGMEQKAVKHEVANIDEWAKSLPTGTIALDVPERMKLNKPYRVRIAVTRASAKELKNLLKNHGYSATKIGSLQVASTVSLRLTCQPGAFNLATSNHPQQAVTKYDLSEWYYQATPLATGDQELYVLASVAYQSPHGPVPHDVVVYTKVIHVAVDAIDKQAVEAAMAAAGQHKQDIQDEARRKKFKDDLKYWVGIAVAIVGLITAIISLRKSPKDEDDKEKDKRAKEEKGPKDEDEEDGSEDNKKDPED